MQFLELITPYNSIEFLTLIVLALPKQVIFDLFR